MRFSKLRTRVFIVFTYLEILETISCLVTIKIIFKNKHTKKPAPNPEFNPKLKVILGSSLGQEQVKTSEIKRFITGLNLHMPEPSQIPGPLVQTTLHNIIIN